MGYKWLNGFRTILTERLDNKASAIEVQHKRHLAQQLRGRSHTYLVLADGINIEIVKAELFGQEIKITRGQEGTEPRSFHIGTCVKWEATKSGIEETVCAAEFECQQKVRDIKPCGC